MIYSNSYFKKTNFQNKKKERLQKHDYLRA